VAHGRALVLLFVVIGLACVARADASAPGPPQVPSEWVTDNVGALRTETRSVLDRRLSTYEESSGHQVLVWIGDTTGEVPLEEFAVRAFERWKVGRKGLDDGIVLFLFVKDRKVRIEVGYGLEDKVQDAVASRIIRDTIVPRIRAGDVDGAVSAGVESLVAAIDGNAAPETGRSAERPPFALSLIQIVLLSLVALVFIVFLLTHPALAAFFLVNFLSQGTQGRGGSGGGFSGGGGRSGGGGASGSW
jgi:uncharacterized protein